MSSSHLVLKLWCSAAVLAAFVLAKDSSSSEESHSPHDHPYGKHNHHHDPHDFHGHHHHPRFNHHFRHHHHHHHHGPNRNITTTTTSSPEQGNNYDPEHSIAISTTTSSADIGIVDHQPDNGGIDLRAFKTVEQTDVTLTTTERNPKNFDDLISESLGIDQIRTTTTLPTITNEIINEHISESTNAPATASESEIFSQTFELK